VYKAGEILIVGEGAMRSVTCGKCGGAMSQGFVIDRGYSWNYVGTWQAGAPRKSFWSGVRELKGGQLPVDTWRCDRCGYLESYARKD
jgi:hypothetical protein